MLMLRASFQDHSRLSKPIFFNLPGRDYANEPHYIGPNLIIPVQFKHHDKSSRKVWVTPQPVENPKPPKPVRAVVAEGKKEEDNEGEKRKKEQGQ